MFIGKLIFGLLTAQLAKWLGEQPAMGMIIGLFFGHIIDSILSRRLSEWQYKRKYLKKAQAKANEDFLYCLFTLAGNVCATDNVICQKEHDTIKSILTERLNLGRKDQKTALKYFTAAHKQKISDQQLAINLVELCRNTPDMLKNIVLLLREISECDGPINQPEYRILFTVSSVFGFDPATTTQFIGHQPASESSGKTSGSGAKNTQPQQHETELGKHLKILGCKPGDTNDKIKRKYRELVAKFHPDKIQGKELPEDFIDFAKNKFTEIRLAYEEVKKIKGF
jgi:DnaJ like chaperone protein